MKFSLKTLILFVFVSAFVITDQIIAQSTSPDSTKSAVKSKSFRATKSQIKSAQELLKTNGAYSGAVDGRYNNPFRASIKAHQESKGLPTSGRLDKATVLNLGIPLTDKQKGIEKLSGPKRVVFRVSKEQIAVAQVKLKTAGLFEGKDDGKYSKQFRSAIREYQSANGLKRKGSLNRATLEKLDIPLTDKQTKIPVNPNDLASKSGRKRGPVFRATKDQIIVVQGMLRSKGLYAGEDTGKLNSETRTGIKAWQGDNGVKRTGTLNKVTLEAMGVDLTEKQKGS